MPTQIIDLEAASTANLTVQIYERSLPDRHGLDDDGRPVLLARQTVFDIIVCDAAQDARVYFFTAAIERAARSVAASIEAGLIPVEVRHIGTTWSVLLTAPLPLAMMPSGSPVPC